MTSTLRVDSTHPVRTEVEQEVDWRPTITGVAIRYVVLTAIVTGLGLALVHLDQPFTGASRTQHHRELVDHQNNPRHDAHRSETAKQ